MMGLLVNGEWKTDWYENDEDGAFKRPPTQFREQVSKEEGSLFRPEKGRYHLFVSYACPWAHRVLITRALKGLEDVISMSSVASVMGDDGWAFGEDGDKEEFYGSAFLREIYVKADAHYTGRVTVPALWDKERKTIVNNESRQLMRMLGTRFEDLAKNKISLLPAGRVDEVEAMLDKIYEPYNNGVYRAGFATSQEAYEKAVKEVFETLEWADKLLSKQRYLLGNELSEADIAMYTTSIRFAYVYEWHFKCNLRPITSFENLWHYILELYQMPAFKKTTNVAHIKSHYYRSHPTINPHGIVPLGPELDLMAPHGRESIGKK